MTMLAGVALIAAGVVLAVRASTVEEDGPGWRSNTAGVLVGLGLLVVVPAAVEWAWQR